MADILLPRYQEAESIILQRMVDNLAAKDWEVEPGDFMHDAIAAVPLEIKQLQINQDAQLQAAFGLYATGDDLDQKMADIDLYRIEAAPVRRSLTITASAGVTIPKGSSAFSVVTDNFGNTLEFTTDTAVTFTLTPQTLGVSITCKTAGEIGNFPAGSQFVLLPSIPGVSAIVDNGLYEYGRDRETDDDARERYLFKRRNPDTGGNKNDYVRWAQEVDGVGAAKCIPRWSGAGTVKVVIVGTDFLPAVSSVVEEVQTHIDPDAAGLGEGTAPAGAAVTVAAASALTVTVSTTSTTLLSGYTLADVKAAYEAALVAHFKSLVFVSGAKVSYNKLSALLTFTEGVDTFAGFKVNGATADLTIGAEQVPVKGTVTL